MLEWLSLNAITLYFDSRLAAKGLEKGRRLFMCEFVKNIRWHQAEENVFFVALCSAEMKTSVDYEIKLQTNFQQREILMAQCDCPAGVGPSAACKHVSAVLHGIEYYIKTGERLITLINKKQTFHNFV